jgi:hypothetical protein
MFVDLVSSMQFAGTELSSVSCSTLQYFSTLSHKRHGFRKKLLNTKCVFWFSLQLLSETFLILRKTDRDMNQSVCWSSTHPPFWSYFNEKWVTSKYFRKIIKYQISWNSFHWEPSCSMLAHWQTDRQTDRLEEANSRFSQFCERV